MASFPLKSITGKSRHGSRKSVAVVRTGHFSIDQDARIEVERIELTLPAPPTANNLFANAVNGGRFRTKEYEAWIYECGWWLQGQRLGRICGPYEIVVQVPRPSGNRRADLDNKTKAIGDLLVKHRVVEDDSLAEKLTVSWLPPGSRAIVTLTKAEAAP